MRPSRAWIRPGQIGGNRREMSADTLGRLGLRANIRRAMDWGAVERAVGDMNARCLKYWGKAVKNASKTSIGRNSGKRTGGGRQGNPVLFVGGLYRDISGYGRGRPRPAGSPIKSWAPRRWFYNDIVDYYDSSRGTVVIGTYKTLPWLAQLHEFGGTVKQVAWRIGVRAATNAYQRSRGYGRQGRDSRGRFTNNLPQQNQYEYGAIRWEITRQGFRGSRNWERTTITRTARYPARPYMQGARRVIDTHAKANAAWRNQLRKSA